MSNRVVRSVELSLALAKAEQLSCTAALLILQRSCALFCCSVVLQLLLCCSSLVPLLSGSIVLPLSCPASLLSRRSLARQLPCMRRTSLVLQLSCAATLSFWKAQRQRRRAHSYPSKWLAEEQGSGVTRPPLLGP